MPTTDQLNVMAKHFVTAALWAECPEGTTPRATKQAQAQALAICTSFAESAGALLEDAVNRPGYGSHPDCGDTHPGYAAAGHDLWLTSQGHGTGFWDRAELDADGLGDKLSALCRHAPYSAYFYRGWIYFSGV
jgi:hypothetical protein